MQNEDIGENFFCPFGKSFYFVNDGPEGIIKKWA